MLKLARHEMRLRSEAFAAKWEGRGKERQDTHRFYIEFFQIFDIKELHVDLFERYVEKLTDHPKGKPTRNGGFIDLFWPKKILVEQKSIGRDLNQAKIQADNYLFGIAVEDQPRYIMVSDFQNFVVHDRVKDIEHRFTLEELPEYVGFFVEIFLETDEDFEIPDDLDVKSAEKMGELHDALKDQGYVGHDLEQYLVRLAFCLFAADTEIFPSRNHLIKYLRGRANDDSRNIGHLLSDLFTVLNTPLGERKSYLDDELKKFPYVNGGLFADSLQTAPFNSGMYKILLELCKYDWSQISPTIFGALFQSVLLPTERRRDGAHYTTEENILMVINPLFMDELRSEFEKIKKSPTSRTAALKKFHNSLRKLTFFDPACGCGNFLVVAYREIRRIEHEIIKLKMEHSPASGKQDTFSQDFASMVDVDQFYGIEINEFAVRIAETALWMTDHLMNQELSSIVNDVFIRIPLQKSPHILLADALETDWSELILPENCSFIFGNPPFVGAKKQTIKQRAQTHREGNMGGSGGTLDYVTNWFFKAAKYNQLVKNQVPFAFVAVNSICQGEQVAQFWPKLLEQYQLSIRFAYQSFVWTSEARGKAHVHCIIIGLIKKNDEPIIKKLFTFPDIKSSPVEISCKAISPYLLDASNLSDPNLVIQRVNEPINGLPRMVIGSKPIDDGNYIFDEEQKRLFLYKEPMAERFMHPFIGAKELINGQKRWILALQNATPSELQLMKETRKLIVAVKQSRKNSNSPGTIALADFPTQFHVTVIPNKPFLAIPKTSSERRDYTPIAWMNPPVIPSDAVLILENATLWQFAILTSKLHMLWLNYVGGHLESRFRYSIGVVYNTFPIPELTDSKRKSLEQSAQKILDIRAGYPTEPLKNLYDPDTMPVDLRRAHQANDRLVDSLYSERGFSYDRERIELLFRLYEQRNPSLGLNQSMTNSENKRVKKS